MIFIVFLIGAVLILVGFLFQKKHKKLERTCTMETSGEVIRMERREETYTETDEDGRITERRSITYYPTFQYAANGESFQKTSSIGSSRLRFKEGQKVTVFYDPESPEQFYVKEDKAAARFGIYFMVFGGAIIIIGIFIYFVPPGV